jgi:hypothetical protein
LLPSLHPLTPPCRKIFCRPLQPTPSPATPPPLHHSPTASPWYERLMLNSYPLPASSISQPVSTAAIVCEMLFIRLLQAGAVLASSAQHAVSLSADFAADASDCDSVSWCSSDVFSFEPIYSSTLCLVLIFLRLCRCSFLFLTFFCLCSTVAPPQL